MLRLEGIAAPTPSRTPNDRIGLGWPYRLTLVTGVIAVHVLLGGMWIQGRSSPPSPPAPMALELAWLGPPTGTLAADPSPPMRQDPPVSAPTTAAVPTPIPTSPAPQRPMLSDIAIQAPADPTSLPTNASSDEIATASRQTAQTVQTVQTAQTEPKTSGAPPAHPSSTAPPPPMAAAPLTLSIRAVSYLVPPELVYPPASRRAQEEGRAWVRLLVDAAGAPQQARIEHSSGHARLDEAALATATATRFRPHTENGVARAFWVLMPFVFELEN